LVCDVVEPARPGLGRLRFDAVFRDGGHFTEHLEDRPVEVTLVDVFARDLRIARHLEACDLGSLQRHASTKENLAAEMLAHDVLASRTHELGDDLHARALTFESHMHLRVDRLVAMELHGTLEAYVFESRGAPPGCVC